MIGQLSFVEVDLRERRVSFVSGLMFSLGMDNVDSCGTDVTDLVCIVRRYRNLWSYGLLIYKEVAS